VDQQPRPSFLRRHGLVILISSIVSATITVFVMLWVQGYLAATRAEKLPMQAKNLEVSLLGKWELIESTPPRRSQIKAGEEWCEFRPDGTMRDRSITTIVVDGKLADQKENLQLFPYKIVDGDHILLNPGGAEHLIRVVIAGDELTLHKQFGEFERYKRAGK
jgi:hypothetical protein